MNHIIETITNYKTKSADPIRDQQVAYIPRLADDMIDYVIPYYILEGRRVIANITNQMFVKLRYLKFVYSILNKEKTIYRKVSENKIEGKRSLKI